MDIYVHIRESRKEQANKKISDALNSILKDEKK